MDEITWWKMVVNRQKNLDLNGMKEDEEIAVDRQRRGTQKPHRRVKEHIFMIGGVSGVNLAEIILHKDGEVLFKFWEVTCFFP